MSDGPKRWNELTPQQRYQVERYVNNLLAQQPALPDWAKVYEKKNREIVGTAYVDGVCYQLEKIKCGKPTCKCAKGNLHGPYWYAYWRDGKRTRSKYIGKERDG